MPYVEAAGAKLYFEEHGQGYPIIFIHEFGSDARQWNDQVRYLSRGYRCIAYNARGYPPSDVPEEPALYSWEFSVEDIDAVMRDLAIERAHLVGSSMGGYAALQFGLRYPDKVGAIVRRSGRLRFTTVSPGRMVKGNLDPGASLPRSRHGDNG